MDEDIFDMNDPEMQALAREAQGVRMNVVYVQQPPTAIAATQDSKQVDLVPDALVDTMLATMNVEKPKATRKPRPWLLSTHKTLVHYGMIYYEGIDFSFDSYDRARKRNMAAEWKRVFYNIIVPNAIIAARRGCDVSADEALYALDFAMCVRRNQGDTMDWEYFKKNNEECKKLHRRFDFYVNGVGLSKGGKKYRVPESKVFSLDDYVNKKIRKFMDNPPVFDYSFSPKLREILALFAERREIGSMTRRELCSRFGIQAKTAAMFMKWIRERRESGKPDCDYGVSY